MSTTTDKLTAVFGTAWHVNGAAIIAQIAALIDGTGGDITPGTVVANETIVAGPTKNVDTLDIAALKINAVALASSAAEIDAVARDENRFVAGGATKVLTAANNKQTVKLDTAGGTAVTLPAATGTGNKFKALVTVLATSAAHVVSAAGADVMIGIVFGTRVDSGNAVLGFAAQSTTNTVTLNRTTTGSVSKGEWLEFEDVAAGVWEVTGMLSATGAAFATPFSHV